MIGVEIVPELVAIGRANVVGHPTAHASSRRCRASSACPTSRRSTGSWSPPRPPCCPTPLLEQLDDDGVLVVPVAGTLHEVWRRGTDLVDVRHGSYAFVPLIGG